MRMQQPFYKHRQPKQAETPNNRHWSKDFPTIHRRNKDSATKKNEREEERNKLQQTERAELSRNGLEQNWKEEEEEHFLNSPIKLQTPAQKYGLTGLYMKKTKRFV
jgi:hypothetical protein